MVLRIFRILLCGEERSEILRHESYNMSYPVFEECFHHVDLAWIPTIYLFLSIPLVMVDLYRSKREAITFYSPATLRIIIAVVLLIVQTFSFVHHGVEVFAHGKSAVYLIGDGFQFFGVMLTLILTIACRNRGVISSGTVCMFWTMMLVCGFPEFCSIFLSDDENRSVFRNITHGVFYILCIVQFMLSIVADSVNEKWRGVNANPCPEAHASFFSRITFSYFSHLAALGNRIPLEKRYLWDLNDYDSAPVVHENFNKHFSLEMEKFKTYRAANPDAALPSSRRPSILNSIFRTHGLSFLGAAFMKFSFDIVQFAAPQLLALLIRFVGNRYILPATPKWVGFSIAICLFILSTVQSLFLHQYFHIMFRCGMNIRSALTQAVYRKMLSLSSSSRRTMSSGQFMNMVNVDIQRLQDMTSFIMLFWSAPLQIIVATYFLVKLMGPCVFAGIAVLIALLPFNSYISVKMRNVQIDGMKEKDSRVKSMTEMINGIRTIKLNSWEGFAHGVITAIRKKEINILKKLALMSASTTLSWACAPFLVAVLSFAIYVVIDPEKNILTPEITFVALSLFNIIRFPLAVFAMIISQAAQCVVSNDRLRDLFGMDEIATDATSHDDGGEFSVQFEDASYYWDNKDDCQVEKATFKVKKGSLVAVVGRVGSGKSSLLSSILGEMYRKEGNANVDGKLAYVPQDPWIMHMTARENICLRDMETDEYYDRIVRACALEPDFGTMSHHDRTVIGDRGISLSGGQKQRISLARAVYARSEIYLLDDPLASVDAHVAKHIFRQIISNKSGMLNHTTRFFVTNQLQFLKHCDQIIYMREGHVFETGSYLELAKREGPFKEMIDEFTSQEARIRARSISLLQQKIDIINAQMVEKNESEDSRETSSSWSKSTIESKSSSDEDTESTALLDSTNTVQKRNFRPEAEEQVETGQVPYHIHMAYLKAIGLPLVISFVGVYIFSSILGVCANLWLARWTDDARQIIAEGNGTYNEMFNRLGVYTVFGLGQAFAVCTASALMALGMVRAGRVLHDDMLSRILHVPMYFFDTTATGKIMTRFSKDIEIVDTRLPTALLTFTGAIVQGVIILFVPIYTTPLIILAIIPILVFYYMILRYYVSTSRQLKRLEFASRGPINSILQDTALGGASIRAFKEEERFAEECAKRVDNNLITYYPGIVANRWLAVRLELVGNLIVFFSAVFAILYRESETVTAGLVGLSISYSLNITQTLNWAVRMSSELETNVVAVERIQEYTELETEGARQMIYRNTPADWPQFGEISIRNLMVKYRSNTDYVLKGLSVHIDANEKIGVVGRTGSGKSTLAQVIFRMVEPEKGTIEIDGQNIAHYRVGDLRARMTIVPQDPHLFSGTLRMNLDPKQKAPEHEIWRALQAAHLDNFISDLPGGLSFLVAENGENISVGQRQLICLARAILRKTKVLILDEAAASVDLETDILIQKTIRREFKDCTVLTIAHRLSSVMECDRIMVINDGRVVEMDNPQALLANPNTIFYNMAKAAGITNYDSSSNQSSTRRQYK